MTIKFFDDKIERFISFLDESTAARTLRVIDLLERFGNQLGPPHTKKVGAKLFELRISGKQEIRIFYTFHDKEIVLLHGFVKKSSRIPKRELENAKHRLAALDAK